MSARSPHMGRRPDPSSATAWTETAVEVLKALWAQRELPASVIAQRLGVSRNAVLGKVHRLGLSNRRASGPRPTPVPRRKPRPSVGAKSRHAPRGPRPWPGAASIPGLPAAGLVARLEAVPAHGCHWPYGDPAAPGFGFCARPAGDRVYCPDHWALAHVPGSARPARLRAS